MTHSCGNGRRIDDDKALGGLDFQVQNRISSFQLHQHNLILWMFLVLTSVVFDDADWGLFGCGYHIENKVGDVCFSVPFLEGVSDLSVVFRS